MCLNKSIFKEICDLYPTSFAVLKKKALMHRSFIRKSKNIVNEEIQKKLTETLTKRSTSGSAKFKKNKENVGEAEKKRSKSLNEGFKLSLFQVEKDSLEEEKSIAFEKQSTTSLDFREIARFSAHPGEKKGNLDPDENLNKNSEKFELKEPIPIRKQFLKQTNPNIITNLNLNEKLEKGHRAQKIREKIKILKVLLFYFICANKNF